MLTNLKHLVPVVKEEPNQHLLSNIHSCSWCRYKTKSIYFIESHKQQHKLMNAPELFSCADSAPKPYKCHTCDYETSFIVNLKEHSEQPQKLYRKIKEESRYKFNKFCTKCYFATWSHLVFLNHVSAKCPMNKPLKKKLKCEQCQFRTKWRPNLKKHILAKHKVCADIDWFQCQHCGYKAKRQYALSLHMVQHATTEDIKWFECDHCSYKAKQKSYLNRHTREKHAISDGIEELNCQHCTYKARCLSYLKRHIEAKHSVSEDNWLHCEHCLFKTNKNLYLKKHVAEQHSGAENIKLFLCEYCPYETKHLFVLQCHVVTEHVTSETKI